jgi:hypothetical protein
VIFSAIVFSRGEGSADRYPLPTVGRPRDADDLLGGACDVTALNDRKPAEDAWALQAYGSSTWLFSVLHPACCPAARNVAICITQLAEPDRVAPAL